MKCSAYRALDGSLDPSERHVWVLLVFKTKGKLDLSGVTKFSQVFYVSATGDLSIVDKRCEVPLRYHGCVLPGQFNPFIVSGDKFLLHFRVLEDLIVPLEECVGLIQALSHRSVDSHPENGVETNASIQDNLCVLSSHQECDKGELLKGNLSWIFSVLVHLMCLIKPWSHHMTFEVVHRDHTNSQLFSKFLFTANIGHYLECWFRDKNGNKCFYWHRIDTENLPMRTWYPLPSFALGLAQLWLR